MKYYIDTEFLEGTQEKRMFGIKYGQTKPTIDLISIALVAEDGREYYAISKDFNLKEAWNRYDIKKEWYSINNSIQSTRDVKEYWIRENVLLPIYYELCLLDNSTSVMEYGNYNNFIGAIKNNNNYKYVYKNLKRLINKYGKTNKQIAFEIKEFVFNKVYIQKINDKFVGGSDAIKGNPEFYGYYADYDWVVFCWLFGKMNDLPNGFPKYCNDLKQIYEDKNVKFKKVYELPPECKELKNVDQYPKQTNEHNALADARWNKQLHEFLNTL